MVKQIIVCVAISLFMIFFYSYSVNYITGKLELEWLENGITTSWNLRLVIILCVVGGITGFLLSKLAKKLVKKNKVK
jgi:uncharacterized membrane protein